jgi:micrococcal nuclease
MKPAHAPILFKRLAVLIFIVTLCSPCYGEHSVKVIRVVDGDTLKVDFHGIELTTRLIGVDTPESRRNKKAKKDAKRSDQDLDTIIALGKKATEYVKRLVRPGNFVRLEFDVQQTDPYGRLLCYVYLQDGRMLNEVLISSGHATIMTIPPNVKYQSRFLKAYKRHQLKK